MKNITFFKTHKLHVVGNRRIILGVVLFLSIFITSVKGQTPQLPIGMNIPNNNYYAAGIMFTDVMKTANNFFTFNAEGTTEFDTGNQDKMPTDINGYPTVIPFTPVGGVPQKTRAMINNYYTGKYVVLHDGVGKLRLRGATTAITDKGNHFVMLTGEGGHVWIEILESQQGNHVRNIRILPEQYESNPDDAPLYLKEFLDGLRPFHALRFMKAMNSDPTASNAFQAQEVWSERVTPTYCTQGGKFGISVEHCIDLCNELQQDAWFCVPHRADDDYITNYAKLIKEKLDPNLKCYIEYSNEIWNWGYISARYVMGNAPGHLNQYVSDGLAAINPDPEKDYPTKGAYMMARTFRLFSDVYGNEAPSRLIRVATGQQTYLATSKLILEYLFDTDGIGCDVYSVGGYFNYTEADHNNWLDMCANGNMVTPSQVLDAALVQYLASEKKISTSTGELCKQYNVDYCVYEGGQHLQPWAQGNWCYNQSVWDAQLHPKMYDLYMENFRTHVSPEIDCKLFVAFAYVSTRESKNGSWGHLESYDQLSQNLMQVAPKYQALLDVNTPKIIAPPAGSFTVDFEERALGGQGLSFTTNGIVFECIPGILPLKVVDAFDSKSLVIDAWADAVSFKTSDGSSFNLTSFDHAQGLWNTPATGGVITGIKSDNTTISKNFSSSSNTFATIMLNWSDLKEVTIDYSVVKGVWECPGALDNFVISTTPVLYNNTINFEERALGGQGLSFTTDGIVFECVPGILPLKVVDAFDSKSLVIDAWADAVMFKTSDGSNFNLTSFDHAQGLWNTPATGGVITGTRSDNTTISKNFSSSSNSFATIMLNWYDLKEVTIDYSVVKGVWECPGALDNFVISTTSDLSQKSGEMTTSVIDSKTSISIYPNPLSENSSLSIRISESNASNVTVVVADICGKVMYNQTSTASSDISIPSSTFKNGLYIVNVRFDNNRQEQFKLIVK